MEIISSTLLLRTLTSFHLTLAYYLLTSPSQLANHTLVWILGEAMDLPQPPSSFSTPSPQLAVAALLLVFISLSDLLSTSMREEIASHYWSSQVPVRLLFFFVVTGFTYAWKPAGGALGGTGLGGTNVGKGSAGWADGLKNSVVFSWGFLEMIWWFWIYVTLRDERREMVARIAEKRKREEDMMG